MEANRTTPEPLDMTELINIELKEQESTEDKTERSVKAEYVRKWREEHKEQIKQYNRRYYNKQREESNDFYSVVRELRSFKLKHDKMMEEIISLREHVNKIHIISNEGIDGQIALISKQIEMAKLRTPVIPVPEIIPDIHDKTPTQSPSPSPAPVIPEILEVKKIKKIRKVKVKQPASPTFSVTSVESYTTPSKFSKNLINEVLDDLIDSDGNVIMSESD
jgi:hypothetical protein